MASGHLEAWSSGHIRMEIDGGYRPITGAVELIRVAQLIHVIARADTDDPAFRGAFPIVMTTVENYPAMSLARDALAELGIKIRDAFFAQVVGTVRQGIEAHKIAKEEMAKLAEAAKPDDTPS